VRISVPKFAGNVARRSPKIQGFRLSGLGFPGSLWWRLFGPKLSGFAFAIRFPSATLSVSNPHRSLIIAGFFIAAHLAKRGLEPGPAVGGLPCRTSTGIRKANGCFCADPALLGPFHWEKSPGNSRWVRSISLDFVISHIARSEFEVDLCHRIVSHEKNAEIHLNMRLVSINCHRITGELTNHL
jgi:hypothetical protein